MRPYAMLCYAMLCCAVLCCAVLCCAMLCCAMLCYAVLCYAMPTAARSSRASGCALIEPRLATTRVGAKRGSRRATRLVASAPDAQRASRPCRHYRRSFRLATIAEAEAARSADATPAAVTPSRSYPPSPSRAGGGGGVVGGGGGHTNSVRASGNPSSAFRLDLRLLSYVLAYVLCQLPAVPSCLLDSNLRPAVCRIDARCAEWRYGCVQRAAEHLPRMDVVTGTCSTRPTCTRPTRTARRARGWSCAC
jgi:hypothetical protein